MKKNYLHGQFITIIPFYTPHLCENEFSKWYIGTLVHYNSFVLHLQKKLFCLVV